MSYNLCNTDGAIIVGYERIFSLAESELAHV